jgi:iron complex outermembrane receptor protein
VGAVVGAVLGVGVTFSPVARAQQPRPGVGSPAPAPAASTVPPVVRTHVDPVYPPEALVNRVHGDVMLALTVDTDGHVSKVDVLESGGAALDEAALVAARQWTFVPAIRTSAAGVAQPVASRIRVPFHFAPPAAPPEIVERPTSPGDVAVHEATQGPPAPPVPPAAEEVRVVGHTVPPSRGASDFDIQVGALAQVPHQNAAELLKLAPGILLTNEGGEGHAEQVFLRGFDAREGQDIEFTVGKVPINESGNLHGNGYADTHFILPELVQAVRVVEGPFDPRQGNYAVAGSADYELGLTRRGLTAKYTTGSFGTKRLLLTWGPPGQTTHTFGGAEIATTDGFGPNRDARSGTAMGQYEGRLGEKGSFRVTATAYATSYHSAGVIRDDDFREGRIAFDGTYDPRQGGDSSRYSLSGDVETKSGDLVFAQQVFLIARGMRLRENFTGFLLDPQSPLQTPHAQRGDLLDLDVNELTVGARGSARAQARLFDQKQEAELGYFVRGDVVTGTQQRIEAATGHPYRSEIDLASKLADVGIYGDANLRATRWLSLRGGARGDLFTYDVNDACAVQSVAHPSKVDPPRDASCLAQQDFGAHREPNQRASTASTAFMPRASLLVGPFEGVAFSASYGRGVRSIDPGFVTDGVKTPFASVGAYEVGAAYAGGFRGADVTLRSVFFQTKVDRDLLFSETAGRNVLGGGTTRTGWVGAARITGSFFDESANVTLVRSTFDDSHLLVPYVPDVVVRSDSALFREMPFRLAGQRVKGALGSGITYVGRRALPYGERSSFVFTVDASATMTWSAFELGLVATNVFDQRYRLGEYNFASDFHSQASPTLVPMRHFTAAPPRGLFLSFAVTLGGA